MDGLKGQDEILANTVKQTPLGHSSFFRTDISDHIKEATNKASWKAMMKAAQPRHHKAP